MEGSFYEKICDVLLYTKNMSRNLWGMAAVKICQSLFF